MQIIQNMCLIKFDIRNYWLPHPIVEICVMKFESSFDVSFNTASLIPLGGHMMTVLMILDPRIKANLISVLTGL